MAAWVAGAPVATGAQGSGSHRHKRSGPSGSIFQCPVAAALGPALAGPFHSTWGDGQGLVRGERGCSCRSIPCMSLNSGALLPWQSRFPLQAFPVADFLPPIPIGCLLAANNSTPPGFVLQSPRSSSQPPCTPVDTHPSVGHAVLLHGLSVQVSLCALCHRLAVSPSSDSLRCFPSVPTDFSVSEGASPDVGTSLLLQLPNWGAGSIPFPLLFFLPFFHPTWLCRYLYCPFWCPRSSASIQPVFCENCCICRCILDAFVERDELHVLLLLYHLEKPPLLMTFNLTQAFFCPGKNEIKYVGYIINNMAGKLMPTSIIYSYV